MEANKWLQLFKRDFEAMKFCHDNPEFTPVTQRNTIMLNNISKDVGEDTILKNMSELVTVVKVEKYKNANYAIEVDTEANMWKIIDYFNQNTVFLFGPSAIPTTASVYKVPEHHWKTDEAANVKPYSIDQNDYLRKECAVKQIQHQTRFMYEFLIFKAEFSSKIAEKIQKMPTENRTRRKWLSMSFPPFVHQFFSLFSSSSFEIKVAFQ
ncbi:unnamed protein product [Caenorhabditis angaria]|uniref:Uncharacterized protein n=1 Tax=Caenorhabditis angaria TaxID=860376 RepID=A0A9P1MZK0_9PELO|nr:unnamed protein product [Caenorhabditis angaria]